MKLSKVPDGTMTGTLAGVFAMSGDLAGEVSLNVTLAAELQPDPADATKVQRKPGTTHIKGTATSGASSYTVDVTR